MLEGYVPAVVRKTSWKEYSVWTSRPDNFVEVFCNGEGIVANLCPFLYMSSERILAVSSCKAGHSRVTDV